MRETNLQNNNQFLIELGFINPSAPPNEPRSKIKNDKESVEKKEVRTVRKSSRLVAEADEKKRKDGSAVSGGERNCNSGAAEGGFDDVMADMEAMA